MGKLPASIEAACGAACWLHVMLGGGGGRALPRKEGKGKVHARAPRRSSSAASASGGASDSGNHTSTGSSHPVRRSALSVTSAGARYGGMPPRMTTPLPEKPRGAAAAAAAPPPPSALCAGPSAAASLASRPVAAAAAPRKAAWCSRASVTCSGFIRSPLTTKSWLRLRGPGGRMTGSSGDSVQASRSHHSSAGVIRGGSVGRCSCARHSKNGSISAPPVALRHGPASRTRPCVTPPRH